MAHRVNTYIERRPDVMKGIAAGVVGGLVAAAVMNVFQAAWSRAAGSNPQSSGGHQDAREWQERVEDQNATELTAQAIARSTIGRKLTRDELAVAAPAVHYGFGAAMGAMYGAMTEASPRAGAWAGAGWGTAIWIAGDEIAVPALGLSDSSRSYPLSIHLQALASHLVYGVSLDLTRRAVRNFM